MSKRLTLVLLVLTTFIHSASAQIGGSAIYSFLNIPASARIAAMGGTLISVKDDDLNSALQNPAALNPEMDNYLSFSGVSYPAGIKFGDVAYAKDFKKLGTFDIWMHYVSYGDFKETDETGVVIGSFKAADYALSLGWGYQLNKVFSMGANLKGIYSDYYINSSVGIAGDVALTYKSISTNFFNGFTSSVVARNIGTQLKQYTDGNKESMPTEVMIAASHRFVHSPFRFTVLYHHLEKFDLTYLDPNDPENTDAITGTYSPQEASFGAKFFEHFNLGAEIILSKSFYLSTSYNFQRKREMSLSSHSGVVGLSLGAGIKISKFIFGYGWSKYHLAGSASHFSLAANLGEFSKKK